jgi:colanic acid/amylovoran biosynthesis glycosyltransferase
MASAQVGYLINQYPKVSHSFIRREILALEKLGLQVHRFALRGWDEHVTDEQDLAERSQTRYLLKDGVKGLLLDALSFAGRQPVTALRGLVQAIRFSRGSNRSLPFHVASWLEAMRLAAWCKAQGIAHVHAHFGTNAAEVAMLTRQLGGPTYSFTVHGPEEFDQPMALKLGDKIRHAAFVVAISSFGRSQLYRWASLADWAKIKVVHCGLEDAFFDDCVLTPPPARARLVCIGRLCEQKGQLLLIQAARRVVDQGHALELVLAGDGEMRADIEAEIQRLGMASHVQITGWISGAQVRQQLLDSRAMVLPSFAEGLPVVIMEAMAMQRPVITTSIAGVPELVLDGQTGWLCPAGDVVRLAEAMVSCLQTPESELQAMGLRARVRVRERHDINREAAKLAQFLTPSLAA